MKKSKIFLAVLLAVTPVRDTALTMSPRSRSNDPISSDYSLLRRSRRSEWGTSSTTSTLENRRTGFVPKLGNHSTELTFNDIRSHILPICFRYLVKVLTDRGRKNPSSGAKIVLKNVVEETKGQNHLDPHWWFKYFIERFSFAHHKAAFLLLLEMNLLLLQRRIILHI